MSLTGLAGKTCTDSSRCGARYSGCVQYGESLLGNGLVHGGHIVLLSTGLCLCSGGLTSLIDYLLHNSIGAVKRLCETDWLLLGCRVDFIINEFVVSEILRCRKILVHNEIHTRRWGNRWLYPATVRSLMLATRPIPCISGRRYGRRHSYMPKRGTES